MGAVSFAGVIVLLEFAIGGRDLQNGLALSVFGMLVGYCTASEAHFLGRIKISRFSKEAALYAGYTTHMVVILQVLFWMDEPGMRHFLMILGWVIVYGGITFFFIGTNAYEYRDRIDRAVSTTEMMFPFAILVLYLGVSALTNQVILGVIAVCFATLFSPSIPFRHDPENAPRIYRILGVVFCCGCFVYALTLFPRLTG